MTNKKKKGKDLLKEATELMEEANARIEIAKQREEELLRVQFTAETTLKEAKEKNQQESTLVNGFKEAVTAINELKAIVLGQVNSIKNLERENLRLKHQVHLLVENEEAKENKSREKNIIISRDEGQKDAAIQLSKSTKKSKSDCKKLIKFVKTERNCFKVSLKENAHKIISTKNGTNSSPPKENQKGAKISQKAPMKIKVDTSKITRVKKFLLGK